MVLEMKNFILDVGFLLFGWFLFWIYDSNTCICCIEELILQSVEQFLLNTELCFIQDNHLVLAPFHKQPPPHQ